MNYRQIYVAALAAIALTSCKDWTTPESKFKDPVNINGKEYYEALRAYKASDHAVCFGWYSEWNGGGADLQSQLRGIPDSMDMVSIWGGKTGLSKDQIADMREVQQLKGTKVLWCQHIVDIGREITPSGVDVAEYWGWNRNGYDYTEEADNAIRKYARAIVDTCKKYGYDGCDFDYEPNYGYSGNISGSPDAMHVFLSEMAKYMGPQSGTGLILAVDGEPQTLRPESGPLLDYYIIQSYYCRGYWDLDNRFNRLLNKFGALEDESTILRKTIWCEDFERYQKNGGEQYTDRDGSITYSLMGMARYKRPNLPGERIGGVGAYRFNLGGKYDDYRIMREVIQEMNPSPETLKKREEEKQKEEQTEDEE